MTIIKENIEKLKIKIPPNVTIVAVSKFHPAESIEEAYHCGLRDFGENYIQEWQKKQEQLSHLKDIRWHIIGNLQKNKVKFLNKNVHLLQSLDSLSLAKEIEKKWTTNKPLNVLIQLQVDVNDINKSGVSLENAKELCEFVLQSKKLNLQGFMGIGPILSPRGLTTGSNNNNEKLHFLYTEFVRYCHNLWDTKKIISLGMSQDLEIALECGSNMLRVGTAIFGNRP